MGDQADIKTFEELEALPEMSDMEAGLGAGVEGEDFVRVDQAGFVLPYNAKVVVLQHDGSWRPGIFIEPFLGGMDILRIQFSWGEERVPINRVYMIRGDWEHVRGMNEFYEYVEANKKADGFNDVEDAILHCSFVFLSWRERVRLVWKLFLELW